MIRLFKVFVPTSVIALLLCEIAVIYAAYLLAATVLLGPELDTFLYIDHGFSRIAVVAAMVILGLYFQDRYTDLRIWKRVAFLQQLCLIIGSAFIAQAMISYVRRDWVLPKWLMIWGSLLTGIGIFLLRLVFNALVRRAVALERILFLGSSPVVFQVADYLLEHPELGFLPIGYLEEEAVETEQPHNLPMLGHLNDLDHIVAGKKPRRIVVGIRERRQKLPVHRLLDLRFAGIGVEEISSLYETTFSRVCTREIRPAQLIFSNEMTPRRRSVRIQSIYSVGIALVLVLIALPVMAIVALLVRLTSAGPALYRQTRVGMNGKEFRVYKFRSMYRDAEAKSGAVWAKRNDPRITPVGHYLRKLRLDELPQLFNVIRGEMSIVGPRPERPEFVKMLNEQIPYYPQRHTVMPGITGWAQISYKYGDTIEDTMMKLEYDLYYVKHLSLSLDLYIMFHTAKTMLLVRGAQ